MFAASPERKVKFLQAIMQDWVVHVRTSRQDEWNVHKYREPYAMENKLNNIDMAITIFGIFVS